MSVQASLLMSRSKYHHLSPPITRAEHLLDQNVFDYGTLNTGVLVRAFRTTNVTAYQQIWRNMRSFPDHVFPGSNSEGIEKARRGYFVYVLPSNIAQYVAARPPCDLIAVDNFLMNQHFALALQRHSLMLNDINQGLHRLRSSGRLQKLYDKWWFGTSTCSKHHQSAGVRSRHLQPENQASVGQGFVLWFVLLLTVSCLHNVGS